MDEKWAIQKVTEIATFAQGFQVIFEQNKAPYPNLESDWLQGLQFYLHGYAYERQGRSPEYSAAALKAVEQSVLPGSHKPDSEFPRRVWAAFLRILKLKSNVGANPTMNPLYPNTSSGKESVTSLILKLDDFNLITRILTFIEKGEVEWAHRFLCQIRGTGNKINSLFLRDIILMYDLPVSHDHVFLQPVGIWVRRLVRLLMGFPADVPKGGDAYSNDTKIAETIVDLSHKASVSPLKVNQGAWYFGSQIAGTKTRLIQYIEDKLYPRDAINQKILSLEEQISALRSLTNKF